MITKVESVVDKSKPVKPYVSPSNAPSISHKSSGELREQSLSDELKELLALGEITITHLDPENYELYGRDNEDRRFCLSLHGKRVRCIELTPTNRSVLTIKKIEAALVKFGNEEELYERLSSVLKANIGNVQTREELLRKIRSLKAKISSLEKRKNIHSKNVD